MAVYKTKGTCAKEIRYEIEDGVVTDLEFKSGCPGNLLGIQALAKGLTVDDIIQRFEGIPCGNRPTSCPDQLATALKAYKAQH